MSSKNRNATNKDVWDKLSTLSTFISTVVIAGLGLYYFSQIESSATDTNSNSPVPGLEQTQVPVAISPTASPDVKEGWAYLGYYASSSEEWGKKYFDFSNTEPPENLQNENLSLLETTRLHVREGMPTTDGRLRMIIDVLEPGSQVAIQEIQDWDFQGYIWARITYTEM